MKLETMLYETSDHMSTITLNRPDRLNAINRQWLEDFEEAIETAAWDPEVRVVVITGAGRAFCAGADITAADDFDKMAEHMSTRTPRSGEMRVFTRQLQNLEKPTIAAVNGPAVGAGFSLALACDMIIASERATFCQMFIKRGLVPDSGSTYFLPRSIGLARANELVLTGDVLDAPKAASWGMVNRVVGHDDLVAATTALAARIAANPPIAARYAKRALWRGASSDLESALETEGHLQRMCFQAADFAEGVAAFLEKRAPDFKEA